MKRWLFAALTLLRLTSPDGKPIWLYPGQIVGIKPASDGMCAPGAPTVVITLNGTVCVREPARDVVDKLS